VISILDSSLNSHNHPHSTTNPQPPICLQEWDVRVYLAHQEYAPGADTSPAGTNPIHNKKPKKKVVEEDEDDKAHKAKLAAGRISCA